ncbi:MAG: hypothetical protein ACOYXR_12810 [Nitrospirota bacterium]
MKYGHQRWKGIVVALASVLSVAGLASTAWARHGEEQRLTNRIPEPAPYVVAETAAAGGAPHTGVPFEPLWNGANEAGGCDGCHTGLWEEWNGAMMSNAWRDPGWRGAFLLVARLTSTDGCADIPAPPDDPNNVNGTRYDCSDDAHKINPFANANGTSTFNMGTTTVDYSDSGSLMDDFCSRCHMPSNYADAITSVTTLAADSGLEHGRISPKYDPTDCVGPSPCGTLGTLTTRDPANNALTPESFAQRFYSDLNDTAGVSRPANTNSGKAGITCEVCHTNVETRFTPYHNYNRSANANIQSITPGPTQSAEYYWATGAGERNSQLPPDKADMLYVPDPTSGNLGYGIGAGAFRLSPHALKFPDRFGPLTRNDFTNVIDPYIQDVFNLGNNDPNAKYQMANEPGAHNTYYQVKFERAEFCASCHDVTNPMTIKNRPGYWVGGFPIERTYTEWRNSRYADRSKIDPLTGQTVRDAAGNPIKNPHYDENYKRDCQTCHMQQTYGEPGTALTLYTVALNGTVTPDAPLGEPSCDRYIHTPGYSHHFVGGNGYMTRLIGADIDGGGTVKPYPELLHTSFSSTSEDSRYHYARYDTTGTVTGGTTQHERFSWDRVRNALTLSLSAQYTSISQPSVEQVVPLTITVKNEGAGHNFPTGFPEGRAAWVAVRAWDTNNTPELTDDTELKIQYSPNSADRSVGIGYLTAGTVKPDPTYPSNCPDSGGHAGGWKLPEGSIDPNAYAFRAMATLDKRCPTLDLPYATPVNLNVNGNNMPTDGPNGTGNVINRDNPLGIPIYADNDQDGDVFDDSFLSDTRLQPCRKDPVTGVSCANPGATLNLTKYSVVVPASVNGQPIKGPIAVTAAVYYQSFEAIVAKKFLGNLADLDDDVIPTLEPCVLKAPCGRSSTDAAYRQALLFDPVVVEGAPPVPLQVRNTVIKITQVADTVQPRVIVNNCKPPRGVTPVPCNTNLLAAIPANAHWSPSPYGGPTGDYQSEGYGELNVAQNRIVKVSFSEPVQECDDVPGQVKCKPLSECQFARASGEIPNCGVTFYLTDNRNAAVNFLQDQIGDTTWALFPYASLDAVFLGGGGYKIHVAPTKSGRAIKDYAGNTLFNGPTTEVGYVNEYTFGFKAQ